MSKHTPVPWNYDAGYIDTHVDGDYIILAELHSTFGPDDYGVDQWRLDDDEYDANGRLMAAAPEMLELLQIIHQFAQQQDGGATAKELSAAVETMGKRAGNLIAKIEGGEE